MLSYVVLCGIACVVVVMLVYALGGARRSPDEAERGGLVLTNIFLDIDQKYFR